MLNIRQQTDNGLWGTETAPECPKLPGKEGIYQNLVDCGQHLQLPGAKEEPAEGLREWHPGHPGPIPSLASLAGELQKSQGLGRELQDFASIARNN